MGGARLSYSLRFVVGFRRVGRDTRRPVGAKMPVNGALAPGLECHQGRVPHATIMMRSFMARKGRRLNEEEGCQPATDAAAQQQPERGLIENKFDHLNNS